MTVISVYVGENEYKKLAIDVIYLLARIYTNSEFNDNAAAQQKPSLKVSGNRLTRMNQKLVLEARQTKLDCKGPSINDVTHFRGRFRWDNIG